MPAKPDIVKEIAVYLALTAVLSAGAYAIILGAGAGEGGSTNPMQGFETYAGLLMWCPALAAIIASLLCRRNLEGFGWRPGKAKYLALGYFLPVLYCLLAYGIVWMAGLGGIKAGFQFGAIGFAIMMAINFLFAAGEEIGWRGFLVPRLFELNGSLAKTSLISGAIWAAWHYPAIIWAGYNGGTPILWALLMFTVMLMGLALIINWLRLKSGSIWPGILLHGAHNLYVMYLFDPLTVDTGSTQLFSGEFGLFLPLVILAVGLGFWGMRSEVEAKGGQKKG